MSEEWPRILLIETSGHMGQVGLAEGPTLLAKQALDATRRHARDLAPTAAGLLRERGWRMRDIQSVFISLGPGSYTGLRVGIMSAKALVYATGCAVVGVPTFEVLAQQLENDACELVVIADAQKEHLYVQRFARSSPTDRFLPVDRLTVVPGPEWARQLRPGLLVAGPGVDAAAAWLRPGTIAIAGEPSIHGLLAAGWSRYECGARDDAVRLEPLYMRRSSAEEQWDRRAADNVTGCR